MEIHDPNLHQRLIEMIDCYMETDYLAQLKRVVNSAGPEVTEEAIKYLALAIMFSVTEKAGKLSFKVSNKKMKVVAKVAGDKIGLPAPPAEIGAKIFEVVRKILHLEEDNGKMDLALGLRNDQLNLQVKVEREEDKESLRLKFPAL